MLIALGVKILSFPCWFDLLVTPQFFVSFFSIHFIHSINQKIFSLYFALGDVFFTRVTVVSKYRCPHGVFILVREVVTKPAVTQISVKLQL